jgi:bacterioferritin-associated ferredoxin
MFVCVCNAINDRTVRDVLARTPQIGTPAALHRACGSKPQCGRCLETMNDMIAEAKAQSCMGAALAAAD